MVAHCVLDDRTCTASLVNRACVDGGSLRELLLEWACLAVYCADIGLEMAYGGIKPFFYTRDQLDVLSKGECVRGGLFLHVSTG